MDEYAGSIGWLMHDPSSSVAIQKTIRPLSALSIGVECVIPGLVQLYKRLAQCLKRRCVYGLPRPVLAGYVPSKGYVTQC